MTPRKLHVLYYQSLCVAKGNFTKRQGRSEVDRLGGARPSTWARFKSSSIIVKKEASWHNSE